MGGLRPPQPWSFCPSTERSLAHQLSTPAGVLWISTLAVAGAFAAHPRSGMAVPSLSVSISPSWTGDWR